MAIRRHFHYLTLLQVMKIDHRLIRFVRLIRLEDEKKGEFKKLIKLIKLIVIKFKKLK